MTHGIAQVLQRWLLTEGRALADVPTLMAHIGAALRSEAGVDRIWFGTTLLHPQAAAHRWVWHADAPPTEGMLGHADFRTLLVDPNSPARQLELGAPFVRYRAARGEGLELPDVVVLWQDGFTDFYGLPVFSRGKWIGAITLSTRAPGGFAAEHVALFDEILPALSAALELLIKDLVTAVLLQTYLGRDAGERVFRGQVARGDGETIEAVVWFSDVRGFTRMSAELERSALLRVLNDTFELLVQVIEERGGEVLKFIGDGLLGVFAAGDDPAGACRAARDAARVFRDELSCLNQRRVGRGQPPIDVGVGLHFGNVTYGNIGAPARLDFTVIGPAVNLASRIEGLCGKLARPVLASEEFVALEGGHWEPCGVYAVKGVEAPIAVACPARSRHLS